MQYPYGILVLVIILTLTGCGYTVLRDFDEEAIEAEYAAISSIAFAPDLAISNIEYTCVPPPPRIGPLDQGGGSTEIQFTIIIQNLGNEPFNNEYYLGFTREDLQYYHKYFTSMRFNNNQDTIQVNGSQVVKLNDDYPYFGAIFTFVIITNPRIQREIRNVEDYFTPGLFHPQIIPITREYRYDNNYDTLQVPSLNEYESLH